LGLFREALNSQAEVDFLIASGPKVLPIEMHRLQIDAKVQ
jgi:hypothetical protein